MQVLKSKELLSYSFFLALLFLFYKGYTFNSWDQAECLPQVYQLLDNALYKNDFFMQQYNTVFTIRHYFVYLVYGLSLVFTVSVVCFALTVVSLWLSIYYFIRITQHFTDNIFAALLSPLFAFFLFFNFTVGGNQIQSNALIPGTLAATFAIAGIHFFLERKFNLSFFVLGVGTLFQPLVTLQVFMLLLPLLLVEVKEIGFNKILLVVLANVLPASLMLAPIIYRQFFLPDYARSDSQLYYEILYRFRNHLHYLPSMFPLTDYVKFFGLVISGFVAMRLIQLKNTKFIYLFSSFVIIGMFVYWLLLEVAGMQSIGKLQWFKATVWVNAFACIALAVFIGNLLANVIKFNIQKLVFTFSVLASAALLFFLLNAKMIPLEKLQSRYQIGNYKKTDLTLLHEWIEQNTDKDAVILCSPENTSMICEAKRSQVVIYQSIIHEPFYMLPWYERFKDIYGVSLETAGRNDMRKQAAELYLMRNYKSNTFKIDYRIDNVTTCTFTSKLGKVVHQSGDWLLTEYIGANNINLQGLRR